LDPPRVSELLEDLCSCWKAWSRPTHSSSGVGSWSPCSQVYSNGALFLSRPLLRHDQPGWRSLLPWLTSWGACSEDCFDSWRGEWQDDSYSGAIGYDQHWAKCFTGGDQATAPVARGRQEEDHWAGSLDSRTSATTTFLAGPFSTPWWPTLWCSLWSN